MWDRNQSTVIILFIGIYTIFPNPEKFESVSKYLANHLKQYDCLFFKELYFVVLFSSVQIKINNCNCVEKLCDFTAVSISLSL